jgi:hypothetical protein
MFGIGVLKVLGIAVHQKVFVIKLILFGGSSRQHSPQYLLNMLNID